MKTKFSDILKVKKQAIEKIERDIQKINASINNLKVKMNNLENALFSLSTPKEGSFSLFSQIKTQQNLLRDEIKNLNNQIVILENRRNELMEELKKANIEYEKIKYLENLEIQKMVKEKRLKESRDMDEIAILLRNDNESK